ncbi:MAG: LruC domain-containing protein [Bacteroidales bacterium]
MKIHHKIQYNTNTSFGPFAIIAVILLTVFASPKIVHSQEYLRVYTSAPGMMVSNVTGGTLVTEDFSSFTVPNSNWAPMPNGYTSAIGTYHQTTGQSYVKHDDQYGCGTGKYMAIKVGGKVKLTFNNPEIYFGISWPAGDGQNTIKIFRNGLVIGTFATSNVIALLPNNASHYITSINGSQYSTHDYYGKPGTGQNSGEPYAYLHFAASSGLAFDEIEFSMGAGGEFENDNHTLLVTGEAQLQGDWVELISIFTPTASDDSGIGSPGQAITVSVLDNDVAGTKPIVASTVQIDGTATAGSSLTVSGEGIWSVNTSNGAITFTPQSGFTGNPTPIQYFVRDQNNYASNLATVTIAYPTGPTAVDDNTTTQLNMPVDINILDNDTEGSSSLDPTSVTFISGTEPNPVTQGTFSVNAINGLVTFTPVTGFTGTVSIDYQVCDINNFCDIATITVEVNAVSGPTANNDGASTLVNTPITLDVIDNDIAVGAALNPASVSFINGTEPDPATEGVFSVNGTTGEVTFTPHNAYTGTVSIDYQVCDLNNLCDIATITINIIVGASNLYPATGFGTLAFEDLWPGTGDYDFNDLVIDYQFETLSNTSNYVDQVIGTFVIRAFGASFENGFGFQLSDAIIPADVTVTGYSLSESFINLESNGTESGQSKPTIIVYDNAFAQMPHPGIGIGVNTEPEAPFVDPVTLTITISFKPNTYTINDLDISHFNPFLIINKNRDMEAHLPYYAATDLADGNVFGQWEDNSDPATGRYYVTGNNLPWAINIYESFDYPIEKQDILQVHLKFAEWAMSGGLLYPDWYKDLNGYRNSSLIYQIPSSK